MARGRTAEEIQEASPVLLEAAVDNRFFRRNEARTLPAFGGGELGNGPVLGVGGFCDVREIPALRLDGVDNEAEAEADTDPDTQHRRVVVDRTEEVPTDDHDHHYAMEPAEARAYMARHCLRHGEARYAVKRVKADLPPLEMAHGALDLAVEARFLAVISHPNIVKMRAVGTGSPLSCPGFFLVLDRLYGTLEDRLGEWDDVRRSYGGGCCGIGRDQGEMTNLLLRRLTALHDIGKAMAYLHGHGIIYRDTKPENVGFDIRGDIKVFDFGLSKVLSRKARGKDGTYKLTGLTGSRIYMAPEVALCQPYNLSADVFSFGTLLWQVLALRDPYETFDVRDYNEKVCKLGYRLDIPGSWPALVREMLKDCWQQRPSKRPDFRRIVNIIRGEMKDMAGSNRASIHNRTTHMMNRSIRSSRGFKTTRSRESEERPPSESTASGDETTPR